MEFIQKLREIIEATVTRAKEVNKISMFSIATISNVNSKEILFPSMRETDKTVCGNILLNSERYLGEIIKEIDGIVEIILVDTETKTPNVVDLESKVGNLAKKSKILTFKPNDLAIDAADALIAQLKSPLKDKKITIIGGGNVGSKLALKLVERGADVYLTRRNKRKLEKIVEGLNIIKSDYLRGRVHYTTQNLEATENADVLIGTTPGVAVITADMIKHTKAGSLVLDLGTGTIFPDAIEEAKRRNIEVLCLFMKPGYDGALETILQTENLIQNLKSKNLGSFSIISAGILGKRGDIIVDNVDNPTIILSIADGKGDVIPDINDREFQENVAIVKSLIRSEIK
ncbi:NAD(P)-binding domain-containing protein [Chloroflexota bacterium]